jgi:predicted nucleotidyltransferase
MSQAGDGELVAAASPLEQKARSGRAAVNDRDDSDPIAGRAARQLQSTQNGYLNTHFGYYHVAMGGLGTDGRRAPAQGSSLLDALFPQTRQRVLSLLFGQPDRSFATTELIKLAHAGSGAVQRELARLAASGIVNVVSVGNQKRFEANRASPIFNELRSIVAKTAGVAGALALALAPIAEAIDLALLYGSIASGTDRASSDIDVLIVSDTLTLGAAFSALANAETELGRRVNPTIYTTEEFLVRRREHHPFLSKVLAGEYVILVGSEDDISAR